MTTTPRRQPAKAESTPRRAPGLVPLIVLLIFLALSGCSTTSSTSPSAPGDRSASAARPITVVAAENFWGSIARQLGGDRVSVTSLITSPGADPHDYEPTAADGRAIAGADLVIVNGLGYDTWASRLVAASPSPARIDLTVGSTLGLAPDANPHRWYDPSDVRRVAAVIERDLDRIAPADADYFAAQLEDFEVVAMAPYDRLAGQIRARFSGVRIGASESIAAELAPSLGLDLITPPDFLRAVSEGVEPTVSDERVIERQIATHAIAVYVENTQNSTPDVRAQVSAARAAGIPIASITETMTPATATWEQWQTAQLAGLQAALVRAAGR